MTEDLAYDFSAPHFAALSDQEREALQKVAENITGERLKSPDDETLNETFNLLRPCEGCLPEEAIGDNLLIDIRGKFACVYYAAVELAEARLAEQGCRGVDQVAFCLVIDPSYEDATHIAVVDYQEVERHFCYYHTYWKAWHFSFASLKAVAEEVLNTRDAIVATYWRLTRPKTAATEGPPRGEPRQGGSDE